MKRVTIDELGALVADKNRNCEGWLPRHDYARDIGAAWRLFEELPIPASVTNRGSFHSVKWGWSDTDEGAGDFRFGQTAPVAICLAWLVWKGLEVEVCE